MNSHNLKPHIIEIIKDLFKAVKSARGKWDLDREEKKQHEKKAINIMESEFVKSIRQAELENNVALVIKGNGPKRKFEETKRDLSTLEKQLSEMNEKKKKLSQDS